MTEIGPTLNSQLSQIKIQRPLFSGHGQLNLKPHFSHSIFLHLITSLLLIGESALEVCYHVTSTIIEIVVVRKECPIDMGGVWQTIRSKNFNV